jgi:apolipoprotein N-acyltransferase
MIPTAFLLLTTSVPRYLSWVLAIIGFASLIWALFRANKEDKESKTSKDKLISAINDLVSEIREDRKNAQMK